jgi:acyl-CoA thioesterase FadM
MKNVPRSAEINYLAESQFDEEVVIKTSEEEMNGAVYSHSICRISDNRELCRIRIEWNEVNNK